MFECGDRAGCWYMHEKAMLWSLYRDAESENSFFIFAFGCVCRIHLEILYTFENIGMKMKEI